MSDMIIDLLRHMKARNAGKWDGPDAERPLRRLGREQARFQAKAMTEGEPIVALYSSPALRCRETLAPLAKRTGLVVELMDLLGGFSPATLPVGAEEPLLAKLRERHPDGGRVVACSHADVIPNFLHRLESQSDAELPGLLRGFGGWYRVTVASGTISISHFDPPEGFPVD